MDQKPFVLLPARRPVNRPDLPPDLAEFYSRHEGVGRECATERVVRLWKLDEVARTDWEDLEFGGEQPEGWEQFAALVIGEGAYFAARFERILYVLDAPCCPSGSILSLGGSLDGCEGGASPYRINCTLVLAASFPTWLTHLERWNWEEPIVAGMGGLSPRDWEEARRYYAGFNTQARDWTPPEKLH